MQNIFVGEVIKYVGKPSGFTTGFICQNERILLKNKCYKNQAIFQKKQTNFQEQKSAAQLQKRNPWAPPPHSKETLSRKLSTLISLN